MNGKVVGYELADPRISIDFDDIENVYLSDVIDQAVANGSIEFSTWSVRIDRDEVKTAFTGLD